MKQHDYVGIVPEQTTGKEIEAKASLDLNDDQEAKAFYDLVKSRLLRVNDWHRVAGVISAVFQLVDKSGKDVDRPAEKGDLLKIDIPGPGSKEGDGFDWVCIEAMEESATGDVQSIGFRVRPAKNPFGEKNEPAHFYSDEATSSFIVTREQKKVSAWIIDRNIKPNDKPAALTDKIRDTAVGMSAIGSFSKIQWQGLADGLVAKKD
jgi:hypothetical protein